ncbi:MAG: YbjN domain-containing protein [Candidatus Binatia bacterium]
MRSLLEQLDELIEREGLPWTRRGSDVYVPLWRNDRHHHVHIKREADRYLFWARAPVPEDLLRPSRRRALIHLTWKRNAEEPFVTFALDESDRLLGQIEQPAATLDPAELRFHVEHLARECDRFEYVLTGLDRE